MAKKPETLFKERIYPKLKTLPNTWVVKIQQVAKRGTPDFLLCINGLFVAIELKKSVDEEPDALQEWNLENIADCGGAAMVAYPENWDATYTVLQKLAGKPKPGSASNSH